MTLRVFCRRGPNFCRTCSTRRWNSRLLNGTRRGPTTARDHWGNTSPIPEWRTSVNPLSYRSIHTRKSKKPEVSGSDQLKGSSTIDDASEEASSGWAPSPLSTMAGEEDFVFENSPGTDGGAPVDSFKTAFQENFESVSVQDLSLDKAELGHIYHVHGYIGSRSDISRGLSFAPLLSEDLNKKIQVIVERGRDAINYKGTALSKLRAISAHSPVVVMGVLKERRVQDGAPKQAGLNGLELEAMDIQPLNHFPTDINVTAPAQSAARRYLQLRTQTSLRQALWFRHRITKFFRAQLDALDFLEVETPLLFKSTSEGAREFLVPTRRKGLAYALPQSPQQYKQLLMASAIPRYFQFAKCFRDEDGRADRQPEFTQLDLEMSFVTGKDVMKKVESMIKTLWDDLDWSRRYIGMDGKDFRVMTYAEAMRDWGSDKPDLRFDMKIHNITNVVPQELKSNLTSIHNPIIDALKVSATQEPQKSRDFVKSYMDRPASARFRDSSHGAPGVFIIDSSKPLQGLHALGFEAAGKVIELLNLKDGDVLVLQARPPHPLFVGGSTRLGDLRLSLQKFAEYKELVPKRTGYAFLWVVDFPLFTPLSWDDSGGISPEFTSTHHPFTSPKSTEDVDLLRTKPLLAKADHYDLVMNGVELGGGSRRIHQAEFQHYIFKDLLKLRSSKLHQFDHLLSALATGCPPHAGFALGFDRLIAVMLDRPSLRDVIAFPKWTIESRDLTVRSPGAINEEDLKEYHLRLRESTPWEDSRARKLGPDGNPLRDATVLRSLEL